MLKIEVAAVARLSKHVQIRAFWANVLLALVTQQLFVSMQNIRRIRLRQAIVNLHFFGDMFHVLAIHISFL